MFAPPTFKEFCKAHKLTQRESQAVSMILRGMTNKQIANVQDGASEQMVKNRLRFVYLKLQIEGDTNGKRIQLMLRVNSWSKEEKKRRVLKVMNA